MGARWIGTAVEERRIGVLVDERWTGMAVDESGVDGRSMSPVGMAADKRLGRSAGR